MPFELLRRASMGQRSSRQIGRALSDRQIQPFDERGVQGRRVLGVGERFSDPPRRAQPSSAFDPYDAIVSSRLEALVRGNKCSSRPWPS